MGAYLLRDGQRAAGPRDVGIREITALRDLSPRRSASGLLLIAAKITPERRRLVATVTRRDMRCGWQRSAAMRLRGAANRTWPMRWAAVMTSAGQQLAALGPVVDAPMLGLAARAHPVAPDGCAPQ